MLCGDAGCMIFATSADCTTPCGGKNGTCYIANDNDIVINYDAILGTTYTVHPTGYFCAPKIILSAAGVIAGVIIAVVVVIIIVLAVVCSCIQKNKRLLAAAAIAVTTNAVVN